MSDAPKQPATQTAVDIISKLVEFEIDPAVFYQVTQAVSQVCQQLAAAETDRAQMALRAVHAEHALAEAGNDLGECEIAREQASSQVCKLLGELKDARAECERLKAAIAETAEMHENTRAQWRNEHERADRAESALAEARKDSERLDWLFAAGVLAEFPDIAAIDAAMKESQT